MRVLHAYDVSFVGDGHGVGDRGRDGFLELLLGVCANLFGGFAVGIAGKCSAQLLAYLWIGLVDGAGDGDERVEGKIFCFLECVGVAGAEPGAGGGEPGGGGRFEDVGSTGDELDRIRVLLVDLVHVAKQGESASEPCVVCQSCHEAHATAHRYIVRAMTPRPVDKCLLVGSAGSDCG